MTSNPFADVEYDNNPSGYIIVDGVEVARTKQCCHCGMHFVSRKGSGVIRGYCFECERIICGAETCNIHIPVEARLDIIDGGNVSEAAQLKTLNKYKEQIRVLDSKGLPLLQRCANVINQIYMTDKYAILGIHGERVPTVEGNVARVRMFIGDTQVDEDFDLPVLPPGTPETEEVYNSFLKPTIEARIAELEGK